MGKNKIDTTQKITDLMQRNVTYHKRKKGLIKKAIELSSLIDADIILIINYKEKDRVVTY